MTDTLTPSQTLLLWSVLAKQGMVAQKAIMPAPKAADRKALEAAKLIGVSKGARGALVLELDDRGWAWAAEHLRDPLPPAHGTLQAMMGLLHSHLAKGRESLGDFVGTPPATLREPGTGPTTKTARSPSTARHATPPQKAARAKVKPAKTKPAKAKPAKAKPAKAKPAKAKPAKAKPAKAKPAKAKATKPKVARTKPETTTPNKKASSVRAEIERAYLAVTGKKRGVAAKLSEIRPHLEHIDRAAVDAALIEIRRGDPKARLLRMDDQRSITPADAAAALPFAGEHLHILWITK